MLNRARAMLSRSNLCSINRKVQATLNRRAQATLSLLSHRLYNGDSSRILPVDDHIGPMVSIPRGMIRILQHLCNGHSMRILPPDVHIGATVPIRRGQIHIWPLLEPPRGPGEPRGYPQRSHLNNLSSPSSLFLINLSSPRRRPVSILRIHMTCPERH